MMRLHLSLFLLLIGISLGAQQLSPKVYDFGTVSNWDNAPAEFTVTNNTNSDLMFLPTMASKDVLVEIADKKIEPGKSGIVLVYYYTADKGTFQREVKLYTSAGMEPLRLNLKGNIASFAPNALIACPSLKPKTDDDKQFTQKIQVIDKQTREPIENAEVTLAQLGETQYKAYTDKSGLIENKQNLGRFDVTASHSGYQPNTINTYLALYRGRVIIELTRAAEKEPTLAVEEASELLEANAPIPVIPNTLPVNENELSAEQYQPNNVLFLIDISKSMDHPDKLPLLKESMKQLVSVLRSIDKITVMTYNMEPAVLIPTTAANNKTAIYARIDSLAGYGWTHGVKGIEHAYATLQNHYIAAGNNQIILSTDGVFNGPQFDETALINLIQEQYRKGVKLSVVGFGDDAQGKRLMRKLAYQGHGNFIQFKEQNAADALVEEIRTQSRIAQ